MRVEFAFLGAPQTRLSLPLLLKCRLLERIHVLWRHVALWWTRCDVSID